MDTKTATVQQVLDDSKFRYFFNIELGIYRKRRDAILHQHTSGRFKIDAFSILDSKGMLFTEPLVQEYVLIRSKVSKLPSRERNWIEDFMKTVISRTILYYEEHQTKIEKEINNG